MKRVNVIFNIIFISTKFIGGVIHEVRSFLSHMVSRGKI